MVVHSKPSIYDTTPTSSSSSTPNNRSHTPSAASLNGPAPKRASAEESQEGGAAKKTRRASPLQEFLNQHKDPKKEKVPTNTRIPLDPSNPSTSFGGRYHIPDDKYDEFLQVYHDNCLVRKKVDCLTECHRKDGLGPILIDLDFMYRPDTANRLIGEPEMDDIVDIILDELSMAYEMEESTQFEVFVLQKKNIVPGSSYVKDGAHLLITVQSDKVAQRVLRNQILPRLEERFRDTDFVNDWDQIYDEAMSTGSAPWPLYGCRKPPAKEAYLLTRQFHVTVEDESLDRTELDGFKTEADFFERNLHLLSARNTRGLAELMRTNQFTNQCATMIQADEEKKRAALRSLSTSGSAMDLTPFSFNVDRMISLLLECDTLEQLQLHYDEFLAACDLEDHQLCEVAKYAMILGPEYYEVGSYNKRSFICWALRSISDKLLVVWIRFMFRRENPDFARMPEWINMWNRAFDRKKMTRLDAVRSIRNIARKNKPEQFKEIEAESIDHYLMATIQSVHTSSQVGRKNSKHIMGCTDSDMAKLIHHLFHEVFVCVNLKGTGNWFHFVDHRWQLIEEGTTLRIYMVNKVRPMYARKLNQMVAEMAVMAPDDPRMKYMKSRIDTVLVIIENLGNSVPKDKIMRECKHLFYDKDFLKILDSKRAHALICMKNGVFDIERNEFRDGRPDDYISMCTEVDYLPDISSPEHQAIKTEIELYMSQMFPIPELCENVMEILSTILHGDVTLNQRMYYLHGGGQNGKGIFTEQLLPNLFGTYYCSLARNFFLNEAEQVGGTNTEVADLVGRRVTVTSEFSEGATMCAAPFKQLTAGTDEMKARRLFAPSYVKFFPQVVSIICSNYFVDILSQDHGLWRRIAVIKCMALFLDNPNPDNPFEFNRENISEKMDNWYEVFLHLLIQRVVKNKGKVGLCQRIIDDTMEYRSSQDDMTQFIHDNLIVDETGSLGVMEVNNSFKTWMETMKGNRFKGKLDKLHAHIEKFFGIRMQKVRKEWAGIRIKYSEEERPAMAPMFDSGGDDTPQSKRARRGESGDLALTPSAIPAARRKRAASESDEAAPAAKAARQSDAEDLACTPAAIPIVRRKRAASESDEAAPAAKAARQSSSSSSQKRKRSQE